MVPLLLVVAVLPLSDERLLRSVKAVADGATNYLFGEQVVGPTGANALDGLGRPIEVLSAGFNGSQVDVVDVVLHLVTCFMNLSRY